MFFQDITNKMDPYPVIHHYSEIWHYPITAFSRASERQPVSMAETHKQPSDLTRLCVSCFQYFYCSNFMHILALVLTMSTFAISEILRSQVLANLPHLSCSDLYV